MKFQIGFNKFQKLTFFALLLNFSFQFLKFICAINQNPCQSYKKSKFRFLFFLGYYNFSDIPSPKNAVHIEINTINNVSDHILFIF